MKKIGILTYQGTRNLGANLQAYALQKTIKKLNKDCDIINYHCEAIDEREKVKQLSESKSIKDVIKWFLTYFSNKKSKNNYSQFRKQYLTLSDKEYDKNNIAESNKVYDNYVVGSDQVWNLQLSGVDFTFFLDFVKEDYKKTSYAASFGYSSIPEQHILKCAKLLSKFNYLSVRELQGKKIINELIGKESEIVLDPIFLLSKTDWYKFCELKEETEDYILLYFLHNEKTTFHFARKLANLTNCKIIYINLTARKQYAMKNLYAVTPQQFLCLIKNAKYVITGSFHATAFSIYFNKQFYLELSKDTNNYNSRIENILNLFEIKNRNITLENINICDNVIDYSSVNRRLKVERKKSIEYLKKVIGFESE